MRFKAIVLRAAGTNCDTETQASLELAGASSELLHVNSLAQEPRRLAHAQLLVLPGGFTFGDDVASGAVLAYTLKQRLADALLAHVARGRLLLGICNGFQALVRLGILPGGGGRAALARNLSGRFESRWVRLRGGRAPGPWFDANRDYQMPVAHGEGRFEYFPAQGESPDFPAEQIALTYVGEDGVAPGYPQNPNGSFLDIAAITNAGGNVMGLMPHPERFNQPANFPSWTRYRVPGQPVQERDLPVPIGLELFRRIVRAGV
ncbi:MAG: phosphoribosylformylglycinamidine synthase subunit PurQ [Planctomycetota bacterium]